MITVNKKVYLVQATLNEIDSKSKLNSVMCQLKTFLLNYYSTRHLRWEPYFYELFFPPNIWFESSGNAKMQMSSDDSWFRMISSRALQKTQISSIKATKEANEVRKWPAEFLFRIVVLCMKWSATKFQAKHSGTVSIAYCFSLAQISERDAMKWIKCHGIAAFHHLLGDAFYRSNYKPCPAAYTCLYIWFHWKSNIKENT